MALSNVGALVIVIAVLAGAFVFLVMMPPGEIFPPSELELKKFSSYQELSDFLSEKSESYPFSALGGAFRAATGGTGALPLAGVEESKAAASEDYSTTNIQVAGVDEADIVKNDGKYAYVLSRYNNSVLIIDAWPAEDAQILSRIAVDGNPEEIFVNGDRLVIFGSSSGWWPCRGEICILAEPDSRGGFVYTPPKAMILLYDISDKSSPVLKNNITMDGSYHDSRMVGDWVYAIINTDAGYQNVTLPNITHNGIVTTVQPSEVYYYDIVDYYYRFTTVLGVNIKDDAAEPSRKTLLTGWTENIFVSQNRIYLTHKKMVSFFDYMEKTINAFKPYMPADVSGKIDAVLASDKKKSEKWEEASEIMSNWTRELDYDEWQRVQNATMQVFYEIEVEILQESDKSTIYAISINNGQIDFSASGEVPGGILNQFSMDEYNGYFRVATTTTEMPAAWMQFRQPTTHNNVYILDSGLNVVGRLEKLAEGETIYSARFMGERAYLVTFRRIDPLFVIDVSSPTSPQVLGQLKIPGFSEYLHPYDENHVIGVGKEVPEVPEGGRVIPEGVKLALFDVTDVANPKEISKYVIGNTSTYSEALNDHKAFLFSKSKELLVIPIHDWGWWGEKETKTYNGAYVFRLTLENGFELRGEVGHAKDNEWGSYVHRSFYIDNVLYTLSDQLLKANSLTDLTEIKAVELPKYEYTQYPGV